MQEQKSSSIKKKEAEILQEQESIKDPDFFKDLDSVILKPETISMKRCPKCNSKMKKKWVKNINGSILTQEFKCKSKTCDFNKKLEINFI